MGGFVVHHAARRFSLSGTAARPCCRFVVGKSRHRAHTESQREESGESQFLGSLWRATLSREAWMPIWGLSTESMSPGRSRLWQRLWNQATEMVRGYGCSRGSRHAPTLHEPKGCTRGRHSNPGTCWAPHSV